MSTHQRIRTHAAEIADHELQRRRSLLRGLPPQEAAAVVDAAHVIATATADCLVEVAASQPALQDALHAIYGAEDESPPQISSAAAARSNWSSRT